MRRVGALLPLSPRGQWGRGCGVARVKPTHNLSLRAAKVQVEHLGAVIRGHLQLLKGLLEQDGLAEPGLGGGDGEALVNVDGQGAILPLPRAGWGRGTGVRRQSATPPPGSVPPLPPRSPR